MSQRQARLSWGLLGTGLSLCVLLTYSIATGQNEEPRDVAELVSASTVAFVGFDGSLKHKDAWEKTAAHEAMYESGMVDIVEKLVDFAAKQAGADDTPEIDEAIEFIDEHGFSLAVSLPQQPGPPIPTVMMVGHDAAKYAPMLQEAASNFGIFIGAEFEEKDIDGRSVMQAMIPNTPGIELGIWAEGSHLVVAAGMNAVAGSIAVAAGDAPNLTTSEAWKNYSYDSADFEATVVAFLNFESLRTSFGQMPIPGDSQARTINDLLAVVGVQNLNTLAYQYGYKGRSLWSEYTVETDGPRTGALSLLDQKPLSLSDLPPLPANTTGFQAARFDHGKAWEVAMEILREGASFGPPQAGQQLSQILDGLPQMIGFDPKTELIDTLGDLICVYADPDQGFLGTGMGIVVDVKDAETLRQTVNKLLAMAEKEAPGDFRVIRREKGGREMMLFEFGGQVQAGALVIDDDWLIAGLMPQSIDAFFMRIDGKLPSWEPTAEQAAALKDVPGGFSSIQLGDPRVSWHAAIKLAPIALSAGVAVLKEERIIPRDLEIPITIADIPPAELVVKPLYPNVTVQKVDGNVFKVTSRQSLPGIPFVSGIGEGNGVLTVAIGAALLLPAVQSARVAAQRTQSANNLKQMGLAMHNYADVYNSFPSATVPNEKLKPNERLSWMASVLPFLDQAALYDKIDFDEGWEDDINREFTQVQLPVFRNPGLGGAGAPGKAAVTHYVGLAGIGKDAPMLPANHKRAGIFGYNRKVRFRDILDGTSNTIAVSEASHTFGPWAAGGQASMRALTKKPYINGPDGIGGPFPGGCNMLFADGSVRFISENIDQEVLEHLVTIAGGEVIGDF